MKIEKSHPYYAPYNLTSSGYDPRTRESTFNGNGIKMKLVNDQFGNMDYDTWYLLPQAYSLTLTKTQTKSTLLGKIFGAKP